MYKSFDNIRIFSGNANRPLAENICKYLNLPLCQAEVGRFADGEVNVKILDNIRNRDVFIIQSTCPPVNDHLMELLIMCDAARRASAASITAVIPYYGYARQDRKAAPRTPITAKLVADLIQGAGARRMISIDLHANQIQGFFNFAVDNLYGEKVLVSFLKEHLWKFCYDPQTQKSTIVMVSPDTGGAERTRMFARQLDASIAIIDKRRPEANISEVMNVVGEVNGKDAVILDDMVDTAGSLTKAATAIHKFGARKVWACATHPVLSGNAIERIEKSPIERLIVTDTVPLREDARNCKKIVVVSVAQLLAEVIRRLVTNESISELFPL
ncbi:MAG: ribose-phosphate pyrophosphokinase [Myxococcales bacterium]|nr:MAG: ribose-phosphate pyrophosphokinase [Myxococcales bacterium]